MTVTEFRNTVKDFDEIVLLTGLEESYNPRSPFYMNLRFKKFRCLPQGAGLWTVQIYTDDDPNFIEFENIQNIEKYTSILGDIYTFTLLNYETQEEDYYNVLFKK